MTRGKGLRRNFPSWDAAEKRVKIQKKQIHARNRRIRDLERALESAQEHYAKIAEEWRYELWSPESVGFELANHMRNTPITKGDNR